MWCPTSNYTSGYCCWGREYNNCPRQGMCSDEFDLATIKYMLCPNEAGCSFSRNLKPNTNGSEGLYEMFKGTFLKGDLCNFKVTNPSTDLNDVMFMRIEYFKRCNPVLIKGESLVNPIALYKLNAG